MMRRLLWAFGCVCSVAVAAAPYPVYAQDWVGSESETIGTFGSDDSDILDDLFDLFDNVDEVIDLEDFGEDSEENNTDDFGGIGSDPDQVEDVYIDDELDSDLYDYVQDNQYDFPDPDLDIDYDEPQVYSNYDTYYGAISSTYLEYMRGFLPKLGFKDHYVAARTGQYTYVFAFGDLEYTGRLFTGRDITVITFYTNNNGSYSYAVESAFTLDTNNYLVYSDLSDVYPSLADTSGISSRQILILLTIMGLVWTIDHMYQVRKLRRLK